MKQKIMIPVLAVVAAVLVAAAVLLWSGVLPDGSSKKVTPDFTVFTAEGVPVDFSDFKGKPVVLNFWASWCGPCKSEMPAFQEAWEEYGDEVQFLMVNLTSQSESVATASAFLAENNYVFPVFYDTAGSASTAYKVYSIPATYFINAKGKIVASHVGAMDETTLQSYLDMIT